MIKIKILGNGGVQFLENDIITTFNSVRQKIKEENVVSPLQILDFKQYPFISVLSSGGTCELFYQDSQGNPCKRKLNKTGSELMVSLLAYTPVRLIQEEGKLEDVSYARILFVFNENNAIESIVATLG